MLSMLSLFRRHAVRRLSGTVMLDCIRMRLTLAKLSAEATVTFLHFSADHSVFFCLQWREYGRKACSRCPYSEGASKTSCNQYRCSENVSQTNFGERPDLAEVIYDVVLRLSIQKRCCRRNPLSYMYNKWERVRGYLYVCHFHVKLDTSQIKLDRLLDACLFVTKTYSRRAWTLTLCFSGRLLSFMPPPRSVARNAHNILKNHQHPHAMSKVEPMKLKALPNWKHFFMLSEVYSDCYRGCGIKCNDAPGKRRMTARIAPGASDTFANKHPSKACSLKTVDLSFRNSYCTMSK